MGALDDLYGHLGSAMEAEHRLGQEDQQTLQQIDARERELQAARADAEGDERQLKAIDSELRELTEAYKTITARTDADDQPHDAQEHSRGGDGGVGPVPGDGEPPVAD